MSEIARPWAHEGDNREILAHEPYPGLGGGWTPGERAVLRAAGRAWEQARPQQAARLGLDGPDGSRERCQVLLNGRKCAHLAHYRVTSGCVNEHMPQSLDCSCCLEVFRRGEQTGTLTCSQCGELAQILEARPLREAPDDDREELIG